MSATRTMAGRRARTTHPRLFTVDEYYRMAEAGILRSDERVELIEGVITQMSPIGGPHMANVNRINFQFSRMLGKRAITSVQNPVRLSERTEPEPDVAILRWRDDFYRAGPPGPSDVLLIIEVSDTTLGYDRDIKLPLYAVAGIPETWIVDIKADRLRVYRDPADDAYRTALVLERAATVTPLAFPDLSIAVDDMLC
jgi:Uma2 family endonuclease